MQRLQAFRYELMPTCEQQRQMRRFAGACRFVFNRGLALQQATHEAGGKHIGYAGLCKRLTAWRNSGDTDWLKEAPVHPLQQALKDLETAYKHFFEQRAGFPRFRRKGQSDRFRYPDPKQIKLDQANGRIFLPKLGWLRYRNSRQVLGELRNVTISQRAGKWFMSIQTRREVETPVPQGGAIGIHMGIGRLATLSDGTIYEPLNSFKRHETALRKAQQAMSRKVTFSANWKMAKARVQRLHARIGNVRRDYLHKTTHTISQNHALVCIEDLQVRNTSRSTTGTTEAPGRHVLARAILDQGWFEFRRQMDYKLAWSGGHLVVVPLDNASDTQALFHCVECGKENADVVGAINVLRRGEALMSSQGQDNARFACEVSGAVRPPAAGTRRGESALSG